MMTKVKKEFMANRARLIRDNEVLLRDSKIVLQVQVAIEAIFDHLDYSKGAPLAYAELELLFGRINRDRLREVVSNAISNRTSRRQTSLEDSQSGDREGRRQLGNKTKSRSEHSG